MGKAFDFHNTKNIQNKKFYLISKMKMKIHNYLSCPSPSGHDPHSTGKAFDYKETENSQLNEYLYKNFTNYNIHNQMLYPYPTGYHIKNNDLIFMIF